MTGLLLVLVGTLFNELSASIGKEEIYEKKEGIFSAGFLMFLFGWVFLVITGIFRNSFDIL